ncbi:peptidase M50 [Bryobacterales bacterium F-183]|nr:peptidase M50 [Bryobacterales bacterium F-183]
MNPEDLALYLMWYVVFLLSVTCHEAAHALVAKWGGDLTAYQAGQVTLNPMPHIQREPWGMVVMPLLSLTLGGMLIGWGSAPYDPYWEQRYPRRAAWMALAGPAANVILVLIAAIGIRIGLVAGTFTPTNPGFSELVAAAPGTAAEGLAIFLSLMFCQNVLLAFFNMLPVPPLDGNTAIALILPERAAEAFRAATRTGFLAMFGIWIAWFLAGGLLRPVLVAAIGLLIY